MEELGTDEKRDHLIGFLGEDTKRMFLERGGKIGTWGDRRVFCIFTAEQMDMVKTHLQFSYDSYWHGMTPPLSIQVFGYFEGPGWYAVYIERDEFCVDYMLDLILPIIEEEKETCDD